MNCGYPKESRTWDPIRVNKQGKLLRHGMSRGAVRLLRCGCGSANRYYFTHTTLWHKCNDTTLYSLHLFRCMMCKWDRSYDVTSFRCTVALVGYEVRIDHLNKTPCLLWLLFKQIGKRSQIKYFKCLFFN